MSLKRVLLLSAIVIAVLALVVGCSLTNFIIDQRLDTFIDDLNQADRDNTVYVNLDPGLSDYDALKAALNWDTWFPNGGNLPLYSLSNIVISDAGDGTATVTATIFGPGGFSIGYPIEFGLVQIGSDWFINLLIFDSSQYIPFP
jgi:hypothetical protein